MSCETELDKQPLRIVICELDVDEAGIGCPLCGSDSLLPGEVVVRQGDSKTVVRPGATRLETTRRGEPGATLSIDLWCARGHRIRYRLRPHRRQTIFELLACRAASPVPDQLWKG